MIIHQPKDHDAIQNINPTEIWNRLYKELMQIQDFEAFGHDSKRVHSYTRLNCFSGSYAAGYYTYLL
jgi:metallopeptidase MepB